MSATETIGRIPVGDFLSDYVPTFAFLVLVLPMAATTGLVKGLAELDFDSTLILYLVISLIVWQINFPLRERAGIRLVEYLHGTTKEGRELAALKDDLRKKYDVDRLWQSLLEKEKREIQLLQSYGFMYVSLFYVFLAYFFLVVIYFLTVSTFTCSGPLEVPIFHPSLTVNVVLAAVVSASMMMFSFWQAITIHTRIFASYMKPLADKYAAKDPTICRTT